MIKKLFIILLGLAAREGNAQVYLNGVDFQSNPGAVIYINNDSLLLDNDALFIQNGLIRVDKDIVNNDGTIQNAGVVDVNQNLINNDLVEGIGPGSEFYIHKNWINNNIFNAGNSIVFLDGNAQQITGSQNTSFYNLSCLGSVSDIKRLVGVDANVLNEINLNDVEFATDLQTLSISNANVNAILRQEGFVSSLDNGRLNRNTNSTGEYLFPVGSNNLSVKYRPIVIQASSANNLTYGVRFANTDATSESYNLNELQDSLCEVNPNFYHRIYGNEAAAIEMFYKPMEDGDWSDMAHWQNNPQWEDMGMEGSTINGDFTTMKVENWNNFTFPAFALAISKPFLELGNDIEAFANDDVEIEPIYIGPPTNNISWTPSEDLDCEDCLTTVANLFETTDFVLTINEGSNCEVRDSISVIIVPEQIFFPTGFSPNNDGINDEFKPMNNNIESINMSVWNRWGEKIFETSKVNIAWDGTYKGVMQNPGVFTYLVEYRLNGQNKDNTQSGSITLLR